MPLAALGLAATAIGTGLSIAGNETSKSAMEGARARQVSQQADLQRKNSALFSANLAKSGAGTADQEMATGKQARENIWNQLQDASSPVASALPANQTGPTAAAKKQAGGAASTWNNIVSGAKAKVASVGDWETNQANRNADTSARLGVNNDFSRADANLLPLELQVAESKGDGLRTWGSIVGALGSIAGSAGSAFGGVANKVASSAGSMVLASGGIPTSTAGGIPSDWTKIYN